MTGVAVVGVLASFLGLPIIAMAEDMLLTLTDSDDDGAGNHECEIVHYITTHAGKNRIISIIE